MIEKVEEIKKIVIFLFNKKFLTRSFIHSSAFGFILFSYWIIVQENFSKEVRFTLKSSFDLNKKLIYHLENFWVGKLQIKKRKKNYCKLLCNGKCNFSLHLNKKLKFNFNLQLFFCAFLFLNVSALRWKMYNIWYMY